MGNLSFPQWQPEFQPLETDCSLPGTKRKHSVPVHYEKQSVLDRSIKQNHKIVKKRYRECHRTTAIISKSFNTLGRGPEEVLEPRKSFHFCANCCKPGHTGSVPWACKRSCRFPKGAVANVGTTGYHCKELPVPRGWNYWFPTSEPWVTIASSCRLPEVGTHASQPGTHRLPLQELGFLKAGTDGSQRGNLLCTIARNCRLPDLKLTVPNLGTRGYHCKELPVPRS